MVAEKLLNDVKGASLDRLEDNPVGNKRIMEVSRITHNLHSRKRDDENLVMIPVEP